MNEEKTCYLDGDRWGDLGGDTRGDRQRGRFPGLGEEGGLAGAVWEREHVAAASRWTFRRVVLVPLGGGVRGGGGREGAGEVG